MNERRYPIYEVECKGDGKERIRRPLGFEVRIAVGAIQAHDERGTETLPNLEDYPSQSVPRYSTPQVK